MGVLGRLAAPPAVPSGDGVTPSRGATPLIFWLVALAALLVPLNSTMIAVALPTLVDDFDASIGTVTLLVTSYLVAMAVLQPLAGRAGDRLGRRRLVLLGLAWFGLASAAAATASSLPLLILWRVQQAVAGALMLPNGIALLRELAPPGMLGRQIGTVMGALPLGAAAGPPLGGVLLAVNGWEAIFLVNLPIVALALPLVWRALPAPAPSRPGPRARALALLRRPQFLAPTCAIALSNMAMYVTVIAVPLLLAERGDMDEVAVGAILGVAFLAAVGLSPVGGRLSDRVGRRRPAMAGLTLQAAAIAVLAISPAQIPPLALLAALATMGAGVGLSAAAVQVAALEAVHERSAGVASGIYSTSRYVGSIVGMGLLAAPLAPGPGTSGYAVVFAAMALVTAAALPLAVLLPAHAPAGRLPAEALAPGAADPLPE